MFELFVVLIRQGFDSTWRLLYTSYDEDGAREFAEKQATLNPEWEVRLGSTYEHVVGQA